MAVSGVHRRSGRRSAALPAVLNANVNANGKRTFAFVPSMPSTASERGPFDRTLVRHAERALRDLHEARERLQPAREPFAAVSAPQHRHRSCRDTARTPSRASPASTTTALEPMGFVPLDFALEKWCAGHSPPSSAGVTSHPALAERHIRGGRSGIIALVPWCALDQRLGAPAIRRPRRTLRLGPLLELAHRPDED